MSRQSKLLPMACCALLLTLPFIGTAGSQSIAFTFDDGPDMSDAIGMTAAQRNAAILAALGAAKMRSVLFATHTDEDEQPQLDALGL
jgi:peptidoglycan-N-acetylglucosamine deacetylase